MIAGFRVYEIRTLQLSHLW